MKKLLLISCLTVLNIFALEIPTEKTELRKFGKSVDVNSQIVQLSSTKQSITTLLDGRIKQYYIKPGQKIKKGQKVALIESIALSEMSAEYLSLKEQYKSLLDNYKANQTLQQKGIVSLQELNKANIERNEMLSKLNALKSQLYAVGINTKRLTKTTSKYILYSHTSGVISDLVKPLHSAVSKDDELFSVVKNQAFYLKSFVPLEYSQDIKVGQRISLKYNGNVFNSSIERVLPEVDLQTQRMIVLSPLEKISTYLLANVFVPSTIYFNTDKSYISVKKTALSFLNNEWVVFIPTNESHEEDKEGTYLDDHQKEKEDSHDEHKSENEESHDIHNDKDEKDSHEAHNNEDGKESHSEEKQQYESRDVKIIDQDDTYVAIEGLKLNENYVSDKTYYVKSLVLKSSMGDGHGH